MKLGIILNLSCLVQLLGGKQNLSKVNFSTPPKYGNLEGEHFFFI